MSATSTGYGSLGGTQHHRDLAVRDNLGELLVRATTCIDAPSASHAKILERLNTLGEWLAIERFQLAVLGADEEDASLRELIHIVGAEEYVAP